MPTTVRQFRRQDLQVIEIDGAAKLARHDESHPPDAHGVPGIELCIGRVRITHHHATQHLRLSAQRLLDGAVVLAIHAGLNDHRSLELDRSTQAAQFRRRCRCGLVARVRHRVQEIFRRDMAMRIARPRGDLKVGGRIVLRRRQAGCCQLHRSSPDTVSGFQEIKGIRSSLNACR
ncbi:hypothetical protein D3C71_1086460 [compost metagenome]